MKRIGALLLMLVLLLGCLPVSAATVTDSGANIVFHVNSPWYIYDGAWMEASHIAELHQPENALGGLFVSINDFRSIFKCRITYNYDDLSIHVMHEGREIWQGLNTPVMFVDNQPYPNPAPYISSVGGDVMIPVEPYASVFGYKGTFTTPPTYAPGQLALTIPSKIYTIDRIEINKAMQMVIVHGTDALGSSKPLRYFLCSTGAPVDITPNGTFTARPLTYTTSGNPWYYFALSSCWVLYCTQIQGNICFHSIPFNQYGAGTLSSSGYAALGNPASHGCIRLMIEDAKFIWENCRGVSVEISDGFYDETLQSIKTQLLNARPSYGAYVEELKTTY